MNNCEAIYKFVAVKYKHKEIEIPLAINNMEKPNINVYLFPKYTFGRVNIFIWGNNYKDINGKDIAFKDRNTKICSLLLHKCTLKLEGNQKGVENYKNNEIYQDFINI